MSKLHQSTFAYTPQYINVQNQGSFYDSWVGVEWNFDLGADAGKDITINRFSFKLNESKVSWSNSGGVEVYLLADRFDAVGICLGCGGR
ncbi:hypothetical protein KS4_32160 [Poriferisphaera corsica]|uniref:Uncharacterized protein n=1 Tax=Poriferisphaera corsica TaxID=2528020 RepID=A0A517YY46_9BACT|nr:hypothetical protein [Poriferisphaera corsica]QDU35136.1 hypothetical protein KS4_32160 [Poriferisphaera corsica]